jgi:hypothetical protein
MCVKNLAAPITGEIWLLPAEFETCQPEHVILAVALCFRDRNWSRGLGGQRRQARTRCRRGREAVRAAQSPPVGTRRFNSSNQLRTMLY